jgi:ribonuclease HI
VDEPVEDHTAILAAGARDGTRPEVVALGSSGGGAALGHAVAVTTVFTDGACVGNPGPGGWAWAVDDGPFASGASPATTNQRMELTAVLEAVRALEGPLDVASDSTYVVNCFRDRWWEGWLERGWRNSRKEPVANRDLWEPLIEAVRARGDVTFRWVKGHAGDRMNDLVDRLAVEAAATQRGRTGVGYPEGLDRVAPDLPVRGRAAATGAPAGAATAPAAGAAGTAVSAAGAAPPPGHRLVVAGLKPPELGGYDANPLADGVRARLAEILAAKRELHPDLVVLTGLGLGAEQLGAEAAAAAGLPYWAVLAHPDLDATWPAASKRRFAELLDGAAGQVVLQRDAPRSRQQAGAAQSRGHAWLARQAHEAVVVWDGADDRVGRLVRSYEDHLGDDVWVLSPAEVG